MPKDVIYFLVSPLGSALLLLLAGLVCTLLQRVRIGRYLIGFSVAWLWLWSMPLVSNFVRYSIEARSAHIAAADTASGDVIVALGGGLSHREGWPHPDLGGQADRFWHAARLMRAGKGERVFLSGGSSPAVASGMTAAEAGKRFLIDLGVPAASIAVDNRARDTHDNAVNAARFVDGLDAVTQSPAQSSTKSRPTILLVTSALHMPRALAAFRAAGLDPIPAATDFTAEPTRFRGIGQLLPSVAALQGSDRAVHEIVGYWYYQLRGWA